MNITQESIGELNALVKINLSKEDYSEKVEQSLAKLSGQVQLKGFRQGKVPKGIIRKMYGNQVLADELNKILGEQLTNYIRENELQILGEPIPAESETKVIDINNSDDFEFAYELGLSPDIDLKSLDAASKFSRYRIQIEDEMLDKEITRLTKQFGKLEPSDKVEEGDLVYLKFSESDAKGNKKENGLSNKSVINQDMIKDDKLAKEIIGMTKGDSLVFEDLAKALDRDKTSIMKHILGKEDMDPANVSDSFHAEVTDVKRNTPSEMTQEFFDKIYGPGIVSSEEELRTKMSEQIREAFDQQTDRYLNDEIIKQFLDDMEAPLPEEFLKKWLDASRQREHAEKNDDSPAPEPMGDEEFEFFKKNLNWSLIYNKIAKEHDIKVEREEIEEDAMNTYKQHMGPSWEQFPEAEQKNLVLRLLQDREYLERVHSGLMDKKIFDCIRSIVTIEDKDISKEEFEKLIKTTNEQ